MRVVWLRNELRINDNTALFEACSTRDEVVCALYLWCPEQFVRHDTAPVRQQLIKRHVQDLSARMAARGIALHVLLVQKWSAIPHAVAGFALQKAATEVYWNDEYGVDEQGRDSQVAQALLQHAIKVRRFNDRLLLHYSAVQSGQGAHYSVFTPFARAVRAQLFENPPIVLPEPAPRAVLEAPCLPELPVTAPLHAMWWIGETETQQQWQQFLDERLHGYANQRDFPAKNAASLLSPYLAIGAISVRKIWNDVVAQRAGVLYDDADKYLQEILWREFYTHLLAQVPRLSKHKPWLQHTDTLPWSRNERDFALWCEGQTGIPIVDAAMQQLRETGWMHNRCRMIVASFLTKNLFIDWRWGERFFMQHLIDGDFASNNGGWQWSASVGVDAAPYFRTFNPVTQAQRFDPQGDYIRRYLPQLKDESALTIHETGARNGYPCAMVDLAASRARAIAKFQSLQINRKALDDAIHH